MNGEDGETIFFLLHLLLLLGSSDAHSPAAHPQHDGHIEPMAETDLARQ